MKKILSEMDLHANLMGMLCPKDNEISAACLREVLDSHEALQAQVDALIAEAVWAMETIEALTDSGINTGIGPLARCQAFLARPDVQAWRERQKGVASMSIKGQSKDFVHCPRCGSHLDTGWECTRRTCDRDWREYAYPVWERWRDKVKSIFAKQEPL
jgi:hypothetical protein